MQAPMCAAKSVGRG